MTRRQITHLRKGELLSWQNHENHVAAIYKLLGYEVTANINLNGQQTDLLCEKLIPGAGRTVLYVECKYTDDEEQNTVSKDVVTQFIANFRVLKDKNGWATGVMVSNKKFSQYAQSAAQPHRDIVLKTLDDLYADLFQIQAYLHSCIQEYEADEGFADYIPLKAVNARPGLSTQPQLLKELFYLWLNEADNNQLCLLGDFGTGKTTFLRHIHHECCKKFLSGDSVRMPLFVQLRDYFDVSDGKELIERFFSLELATRVPQRVFDEFNRAGRFLLLLDGFDEMGVTSDSESRRRSYLKLNQLIRADSKLVITCRPAYFVTHKELLDVFDVYKEQMGFTPVATRGDSQEMASYSELSTQLQNINQNDEYRELLSAVGHVRRHSSIANIELFDHKQIRAYLRAHKSKIHSDSDGQLDDKSLYTRIEQVYDLEDLAKRPILLKLIVSTLPLFKRESNGKYRIKGSSNSFDDITPSVLYYAYTEGELTREYEKGEVRWQIDRNERRAVIGLLAFEMFESDVVVLEPTAFSSTVAKYFPRAGEKLEQLTTDIRTCSFLSLDSKNYLRFAHKSFLEYYVAQHMADLLRRRKVRGALTERILSDEVFYFLGDLIRSFYQILLRPMHELATSADSVTRCNALNLLNYAGHPRPLLQRVEAPVLSYVKLKISSLELDSCYVESLRSLRSEIQNLTLKTTTINKLSLQSGTINIVLVNTTIKVLDCSETQLQVNINNSRIKTLNLTNTVLQNSRVADGSIVLGPSYGSTLREVQFHNVLFTSNDQTHLRKSKIQKVLFDECIFLYVDFDNDFLNAAAFRRCVFVRCYLRDGLALDRLSGSRGVFQYKGLNKTRGTLIEIRGRPFLWTTKKIETAASDYQDSSSIPANGKDRRDPDSQREFPWEAALVHTFPGNKGHDFLDWEISEIRTKLKRMTERRQKSR